MPGLDKLENFMTNQYIIDRQDISAEYGKNDNLYRAISTTPCVGMHDLISDQIKAVQIALYKWLSRMPYYKNRGFDALFKNFGSYDDFTVLALKIFCKCYDLKFYGCMTTEIKKALCDISAGIFANMSSIYRIKSALGENLYIYACKYGLKSVSRSIKKIQKLKHPACKIYKIGDKSQHIGFIQTSLDAWRPQINISSMSSNPFKTNVFDNNTAKILKMFNYRFGISANQNEITPRHLAIFKELLINPASAVAKYPLKTILQQYSNKLFRKERNIDKALKKIAVKIEEDHKKERRQLVGSRYSLPRMLVERGIDSEWGRLNEKNIISRLGIHAELAVKAFEIKYYLAQHGYHIHITSGLRSNGNHTQGYAFDFVIIGLSVERSFEVVKLLKKLNIHCLYDHKANSSFRYINEYDPKYHHLARGSNIHIEMVGN